MSGKQRTCGRKSEKSLNRIFVLEEFDGVTADADVGDFVSRFGSVGEDVAGALHFNTLLDMNRPVRW